MVTEYIRVFGWKLMAKLLALSASVARLNFVHCLTFLLRTFRNGFLLLLLLSRGDGLDLRCFRANFWGKIAVLLYVGSAGGSLLGQ